MPPRYLTLKAQDDLEGAWRLRTSCGVELACAWRGTSQYACASEQPGFDTTGARRSRGGAEDRRTSTGGEHARTGRGASGHADLHGQPGGEPAPMRGRRSGDSPISPVFGTSGARFSATSIRIQSALLKSWNSSVT